MADAKGQGGQPTEWIPLVLAVGLLIAFLVVAFWIANTANEAPRLADPAPSTPPTLGTNARDYPPQYRGDMTRTRDSWGCSPSSHPY
jgi:hypothetical protein